MGGPLSLAKHYLTPSAAGCFGLKEHFVALTLCIPLLNALSGERFGL
jgi:hypothetical protein